MSDKCKACPFCGCKEVFVRMPTCTPLTPYDPADRAFPLAECGQCYASVPGDNWDRTGVSAMNKWDRRTPDMGVLAA